jgi:hypothetical protein
MAGFKRHTAKRKATKKAAKKSKKRTANFGRTRKTDSGTESSRVEKIVKGDHFILPHGYAVKHLVLHKKKK